MSILTLLFNDAINRLPASDSEYPSSIIFVDYVDSDAPPNVISSLRNHGLNVMPQETLTQDSQSLQILDRSGTPGVLVSVIGLRTAGNGRAEACVQIFWNALKGYGDLYEVTKLDTDWQVTYRTMGWIQ